MRVELKCIGWYRGWHLFNDGGDLFAIESEVARGLRTASDDDIILGGRADAFGLKFIFMLIDSRAGDAPTDGDWMRLDWQ